MKYQKNTPLVLKKNVLVCHERDFMMSLSDDKQTATIDAFNATFPILKLIIFILTIW